MGIEFNMQIWVHTLVKNEERYLWYAVSSVVGHVDKVLLWDTGSTDNTVKICNEIRNRYPQKIHFRHLKISSADEFARVRNEMLEKTAADWFLMVDGDEVWWEESIRKVIKVINERGNEIESIVVPMIYSIGDIYHRQEKAAGKYKLAGRMGHYALRAINRKIPGLSSSNPHGTWGWTDKEGKMIQDRAPDKIIFVDAPYMHFSHLPRAGTIEDEKKVIKRSQKIKHELGDPFPRDFYYPEVFFRKRPDFVPSPWKRMPLAFYLRALLETPLRKIKRRIWQGKAGY